MLDDSQIKSNIVRDLVRYVPQMVIPALIAFVSVPVYTRLFPPAAYGNFNLVRVSNSLLERASGWIGCSLTRYYNDYLQQNRQSYLLTNIMKVNGVIGMIVVLAVFVLLQFFTITSELAVLFKVGFLLFTIQLFYNTLSNVLRMERRINTQSLFILISSLSSFALSILLVTFFGMNIEAILTASLAVTLLLLPFLWKLSIGGSFQLAHRMDFGMLKKFAVYGVPLTVSSMGIWILDLSDRYIIKVMLDSYQVGVYSACYNVIWNSLFLVVNGFFMMEEPLAMRIYVNDGKEFLAKFIRCETRLFLMVIVPLTALVCCYSRQLLSVMVASKYMAGAGIVPYVAISVVVVGVVYKYHLGFLAMERTRTLMCTVLVSGGSNILLNVFLVPRLGILGAGIATLLSYLLYLFLVVVSGSRFFVWNFPLLSLGRVTVSAVVAVYGLELFVRTASLTTQVATMVLSVVAYLILLRLLNEIDREEVGVAKEYLRSWSKRVAALLGSA